MKKTLRDTYIPDFKLNTASGLLVIRRWRQTKKLSTSSALRPGNIVFCMGYDATTVPFYDKNPCILILKVSNSYLLGLNINWLSRTNRQRVIRQFIKAYNKNPLSRIERFNLFKKLKSYKYMKKSIRLYKLNELKTCKLYELTMGEFYEAITTKLLSKEMLK